MSYVPARLRQLVLSRAAGRCEYCKLSQKGQEATFHTDHVIPKAAGGKTDLDNLALACVSCSLRKAARRAAVDPRIGLDAPLYNPREQALGRSCRLAGRANDWTYRCGTSNHRGTEDESRDGSRHTSRRDGTRVALTTITNLMNSLTHFDDHGASRMVDTTAKPQTERVARASGRVRMASATIELIRNRGLAKGDVLEVARLAGIMAAKKTADIIPLCHPLSLTAVNVDFSFEGTDAVRIESTVKLVGRTGAEMEALTAVSVVALTIYDMCKSVDKTMTIESIRLEEKSGGKSGHFVRGDD